MLKNTLNFDDLLWYGRNFDFDGARWFSFSACGFEFCFTGTEASCVLRSDSENWDADHKCVLGVYVSEISADGYSGSSFWNEFPSSGGNGSVLHKKIVLDKKNASYLLYKSSCPGTFIVRVIKLSEAAFGLSGLESVEIAGEQVGPASAPDRSCPKIEFIGDSITCGYGIEGVNGKDSFSTLTERPDLAFAFLSAKKLRAGFSVVSWSGSGLISHYVEPDVEIPCTEMLIPALWPYTDRSTALRLGLEPEPWNSARFEPDVVVINLGTNDMSFARDDAGRAELFTALYCQLLEGIYRRSPDAAVLCCLGVMGQKLCPQVEAAAARFRKDFPSVSVESVVLPEQLEQDGIGADFHPSARTHEKMAELVSERIEKILCAKRHVSLSGDGK